MDVGLKANGARQFQISMENQFNNGEFVVTSATKDSQVKILVTQEWIHLLFDFDKRLNLMVRCVFHRHELP